MATIALSSESRPQLPTELIELIIKETWALPLSTHDRVTFMKTSLAVNSTWLSIYLPIACRDVHIPSAEYALFFYRILTGESELYNTFAPGMHDRLCRSITFHGTNNLVHPRHAELGDHPTGLALAIALQVPHASSERLVHLRRIRITYSNCVLDDFFGRHKYFEFPSQVTDLELHFSWDDATPRCVVDAMRSSKESLNLAHGSAPSIQRLKVHGASKGMMNDFHLACPNLVNVEST